MGSVTKQSGKGITGIDWLMNPAGSFGKYAFGIQADPISDATASLFQSTVSSDYRDEHDGYSIGNSWLADIVGSNAFGMKNEAEVDQANDPAWQAYYESIGSDKWGNHIPDPVDAGDTDTKTETEPSTDPNRYTKAPSTSLIDEDDDEDLI